MIVDGKEYKSLYEEQPLRKQKRISYLVKKGRLDVYPTHEGYWFNEEDYAKQVCKHGEIPLTPEEFEDEPFLYYVSERMSDNKGNYALKKFNIPKFMDVDNCRVCFRMVDVFTSEINEMSEKFNIPKEEIRGFLTRAWRLHNKKKDNHYIRFYKVSEITKDEYLAKTHNEDYKELDHKETLTDGKTQLYAVTKNKNLEIDETLLSELKIKKGD